jgi:hypothetical protein
MRLEPGCAQLASAPIPAVACRLNCALRNTAERLSTLPIALVGARTWSNSTQTWTSLEGFSYVIPGQAWCQANKESADRQCQLIRRFHTSDKATKRSLQLWLFPSTPGQRAVSARSGLTARPLGPVRCKAITRMVPIKIIDSTNKPIQGTLFHRRGCRGVTEFRGGCGWPTQTNLG